MALFQEKTMKVVGVNETQISMEDALNKLRAYRFMQSHILPNLGNLPDPDVVAMGMDMILSDIVDEIEAVVATPMKDGDGDYQTFKERVEREEEEKEKKITARLQAVEG